MTRYDISVDYQKKFTDTNENVISYSMKPYYISLNSNEAKVSTNPYSFEEAEHGLVIFHYKYIVQTQPDYSMVPLFFNSNGEIEDYIQIDGWKMSFSKPKTAMFKSNGIASCIFTRGSLKMGIASNCSSIIENFNNYWELFSLVRQCSTQLELNFLKDIFNLKNSITELKEKNIYNEAVINEKNRIIDSYKSLLEKIDGIVSHE